jgi:hypothetical protein
MKVLDLRCGNGHGFEGWFGSEDEFLDQNGRAAIECPLCGDRVIARLPSAPRLNLSAGRDDRAATAPDAAAAPAAPATPVQAWLGAARRLLAQTEDVGARFPEEARRMHYGESPHRGIRGQASPDEREALREEGIEVMALPLPDALKEPLQ